MSSFSRSILLTFFGLLTITTAFAQPKVNSPFSRFGLGDLLDQRFAAYQVTGFTNTYHDYYHLNLHNPASLGHITSTAFEVGLYSQRSNWESGTNSNTDWSGNLTYLALGVPLNNPINQVLDRDIKKFNWGMAFNLQPYTLVGFDVETTGNIEEVGGTTTRFRGSGGTYRAQWGNGFKYKNFSAGLNLGYIFGRIESNRNILFDDIIGGYENRLIDDFSINGFTWNLGAQYDYFIKTKDTRFQKSITIGVTGNSAHSIDTNTSQFYERFNIQYTVPQDTILSTNNLQGEGRLPAALGFGLVYTQANKWKVGFNYDYTAWSGYRNDAKEETLKDSWRLSVGAEFTPDYASYNNFGKKIRYQVGAFIGRDPRSIGGEQIEQRGVSFGFGLPLTLPRQQVSFINFAFEFGQNGGNTSIQETYGRLTVGFTLNDNSWFFKRKFN